MTKPNSRTVPVPSSPAPGPHTISALSPPPHSSRRHLPFHASHKNGRRISATEQPEMKRRHLPPVLLASLFFLALSFRRCLLQGHQNPYQAAGGTSSSAGSRPSTPAGSRSCPRRRRSSPTPRSLPSPASATTTASSTSASRSTTPRLPAPPNPESSPASASPSAGSPPSPPSAPRSAPPSAASS
jgi:hypothetical protein